jgi:hypothetical protein
MLKTYFTFSKNQNIVNKMIQDYKVLDFIMLPLQNDSKFYETDTILRGIEAI